MLKQTNIAVFPITFYQGAARPPEITPRNPKMFSIAPDYNKSNSCFPFLCSFIKLDGRMLLIVTTQRHVNSVSTIYMVALTLLLGSRSRARTQVSPLPPAGREHPICHVKIKPIYLRFLVKMGQVVLGVATCRGAFKCLYWQIKHEIAIDLLLYKYPNHTNELICGAAPISTSLISFFCRCSPYFLFCIM